MEMEMVAFMKNKVGMDKSGLTIQLSIPSYLENYEEILVNLNRILSYDRLVVKLEAEVPTPEKDEDGDVTVTLSSRQARMF